MFQPTRLPRVHSSLKSIYVSFQYGLQLGLPGSSELGTLKFHLELQAENLHSNFELHRLTKLDNAAKNFLFTPTSSAWTSSQTSITENFPFNSCWPAQRDDERYSIPSSRSCHKTVSECTIDSDIHSWYQAQTRFRREILRGQGGISTWGLLCME